jgi:hypothetical protein
MLVASGRQMDRRGLTRLALAPARLASRHRLATVTVVVAALVRLLAVLAYRPALWFNDSYEYVGIALRLGPYPARPSGYSFFLAALEPLHSFVPVVVVQHLLGLAVGALVYTVARHRGFQAWSATLAAAPQLFDGYQVALEHLVLSETLYSAFVVTALVCLLWRRRPTALTAGAAALCLAGAAVTRSLGLPLAVLAGLWLVAVRPGWRVSATFVGAFALPLLAYSGWNWSVNGDFATSDSAGAFLYARTMTFAECARIDPPAALRPLCPTTPVSHRQAPSYYLWHQDSGLYRLPGGLFTPAKERLASEFALDAIAAQPVDYAAAVARDFLRTFSSRLGPYPSVSVTEHYTFAAPPPPITGRPSATIIANDLRSYGHTAPVTRADQPFARWMSTYQRHIDLPAPLIGAALAAGLTGLVTGLARRADTRGDRRQYRAPLALLLGLTVATLLLPPATAGFDYRYVAPALPLLGLLVLFAVRVVTGTRQPVGTPPPAADLGVGDAEPRGWRGRTVPSARQTTEAAPAPSPAQRPSRSTVNPRCGHPGDAVSAERGPSR